MYDGGKVIIGLIVLFIICTFPFFYNMGRAAKVPEPKLDTPAIKKLPEWERVCVQPTPWMRANHMRLLDHWRNWALREANREYIGFNGKRYTISLQNTCLNCHSNYDKFCNECHSYMGIKPYCWGCHLQKPKEWAKGELKEGK